MLGWFGELNAKERRTLGACLGGWVLEAFDVQMYSFVIPTVIALWGLSRSEAGFIGTVKLLIVTGRVVSGTLAYHFGRVRMLQITILWYSVFTFLLCVRAELRAALRVAGAALVRPSWGIGDQAPATILCVTESRGGVRKVW